MITFFIHSDQETSFYIMTVILDSLDRLNAASTSAIMYPRQTLYSLTRLIIRKSNDNRKEEIKSHAHCFVRIVSKSSFDLYHHFYIYRIFYIKTAVYLCLDG